MRRDVLVDTVGRTVVGAVSRLRVPRRTDDAWLAVRSTSLGDLVACLPFLATVRRLAGDRRLDLLTLSRTGDVATLLLPHWEGRRLWIDPAAPGGIPAQLHSIRSTQRSTAYDAAWFAPHNSEGWSSIARKLAVTRAVAGSGATLHGFDRRPLITSPSVLGAMSDRIALNQALSPFTACGLNASVTRREALSLVALTDEEIDVADRTLAPLAGKNVVAMYVHAKDARKRWPLERYIEIARTLLVQSDAAICFVGGSDDVAATDAVRAALPRERTVSIVGRASVRESLATLTQCGLFVGNDGSPTHLAALAGARIVALYCNWEAPGLWEPIIAPRTHALRPAWNIGRVADDYGISAIPVHAVIRAIAGVTARTPSSRHTIETVMTDGTSTIHTYALSPTTDE